MSYYWEDLSPSRGHEQAGRRPVLVIRQDVFNDRSGTVIALALTRRAQRAGLPIALKIETARLPNPSWVKVSQIRTLSTERLGKRLGRISPEELQQVIEGLSNLLRSSTAAVPDRDHRVRTRQTLNRT